jgi:hypothetical protein
MKTLLLAVILGALSLHAQADQRVGQRVDPLDGLWQGYDGEWRHVSNQLVALAEAIPADKYVWRPASVPPARSSCTSP